MLIRYNFNNYCSFWGDNEFALIAPKGKVKRRFPDNFVENGHGCDCLKTAVIVGENAGGKSNFINGLKYLKSFFSDNQPVYSYPVFLNSASVDFQKDQTQIFELEILAENQIYRYQLEIDAKGIIKEKLSFRSEMKDKDSLCFIVQRMDDGTYTMSGRRLSLPPGFEKRNANLGLFITKFALLGNEHALRVTNWVNHTFCVESLAEDYEEGIRKTHNDLEILKDERYLEIFRMVDHSICGIEIDEEKPYTKTLIIRKNQEGRLQKRELAMDSAGVREFFSWAVQIFRVVNQNQVIFADEMDRVLNPILADRVLAYIHGKKHCGQFIFTTHNVLHLNLSMFMKEQIYFITKNKDTLISELYALSDFPEVRYETTKIYEFYMKGILGGTSYE